MLLMSLKLYLFSMFNLLPMILFSECGKKENMEPVDSYVVLKPSDASGISYLALGDSYTKAECEVSTNSYPSKLVQKFQENGLKVSGKKTIAQTGWRTDDLKNAINNASMKDTFDLVSLLIGVNNQYQGKSLQTYKTEFLGLLETAIYYAKGRKDKVFVISIPDYGVTPFGRNNQVYISKQIDLFNAVNKEVTDSMGVKYFDITPISREAAIDKTLICTDGLHPSGKMYSLWVDLMLKDVLSMAAQK
jgi:lysophospholipase L1-like esterase